MSDLPAQQAFFAAFARWGVAVTLLGYRCTFGDAFRDSRATFPYARPGGFHTRRLAVDVNLFDRDGVLVEGVEGWRQAGELWESLGGTWGGAFRTGSPGDANHLSWGER